MSFVCRRFCMLTALAVHVLFGNLLQEIVLIIVVMKLPNTHDDPTIPRSYDWSVGREPFLARIAAYQNLAFGTWMHSVRNLHGYDEDLKHKNTSPKYGRHAPSPIPFAL